MAKTDRRSPNPGVLCGHPKSGRSTAGEGPCRQPAGYNTDHLGWGWCYHHGGNTPSGKKYAARLEADAAKARVMLGAPADISPAEAIDLAMRATQGHVEWLQQRIAEAKTLEEISGPILSMYAEERRTLLALAKSALDANVAERHVKLAEQQGEMVYHVINAVLSDPELGLSPVVRVLAVGVIKRHLQNITEPVALPPGGQEPDVIDVESTEVVMD